MIGEVAARRFIQRLMAVVVRPTDAYGGRIGLDLTPDHAVDNLSMAMSLAASTGGIPRRDLRTLACEGKRDGTLAASQKTHHASVDKPHGGRCR
jgi:hypothetical protein